MTCAGSGCPARKRPATQPVACQEGIVLHLLGGQMESVLLRLDSDRPKVGTSHLQTNVVLERPASVTDRGYTFAGTHDWR
ncbi:hypothetical protein BDQ94DRAFT_165841 [Aspergillus welwitschiae]|uniref:Uncharacterized protein n=1 Tax=Aspergillus welwitschiae TaxID=1341132 RepID=A0A3F3QHH5_9EURO|nr:hypothetical protein BDQ94DRAFT_165841 [Aspergillus welwitschiae]RDH38738.1 hypothetical protein BDQ94DRAFT_165841 [Aspergillus welwitschiae]